MPMSVQEAGGFKFSSDGDAHEHAMSLSLPEVVRELVDLLGATTVASLGGVNETRAVAQWMNGREPQRAHTLRFTLQIVKMIATPQDGEVTRAWLHGSNPYLNDAAPLTLLRERPLDEVQAPLLKAARAFGVRKANGSR